MNLLKLFTLYSVLVVFFGAKNIYSQSFAVIGDFGSGSENEAAVSEVVHDWNVDFIITVGDNNYPDGEAETIDEHVGQFYSEYIYPYVGVYGDGAEENRFYPTLGNHDVVTLNGQPHLDYFTLPGNERYYDFVKGDVHFFALNSNFQEPDGISSESIQAEWLQEQLTNSNSIWQVVYLHESPYSSGLHGSSPELRWPFAEWGADVVLSGHDHHYERSEVDCIPYILNGLGGGVLHNLQSPNIETRKRYSGQYGALKVEASLDNMRFEFWNVNGELIDEYTIFTEAGDERIYRCTELLYNPSAPLDVLKDVKFADLNHDNLEDVVYVLNESLVRQKNLGTGIFNAPATIISGLGDISLLSLQDVNSDSNTDFLVVNDQSEFYWLLGDSNGNLVGTIPILNTDYIGAISTESVLEVAVDLNQDENIDLFWVDIEGCALRGNLNLSEGAFGESVLISDLDCEELIEVNYKDMNGDELEDFVVWTESGAYWIENLGGGSFNSEFNWIDQNENYVNRIQPILVDVSGDGRMDILSTAENLFSENDYVFFYENDGDGQFVKQEIGTFNLNGITYQESISIGDINGNSLIDFLVKGNSEILWLEYTEGIFIEQSPIATDWSAVLTVEDIDSDGIDNLFYADLFSGSLIQISNTEGNWEDIRLIETSFFFNTQDVYFNDLDGDSDLDLMVKVFTSLGPTLVYYDNHTFQNSFTGWPGDFDRNGGVNSLDLSIFLSVFGESCSLDEVFCIGDLNNSGEITVQDLAQFLSLFGTIYCD